MIITAPLLFPENPTEGRDFPLYTPLLDDEDVLTTDFLGEQKQIFDDVIDNIHLFLNNCFVFIAESLRRTPTDTLEISGRTSRGMRRNSMKPGVKHKMSANSEKLSPTGNNNNGNKLPASKRKSSSNRRS